MSGTTSQPNLNSLVAALASTERESGLNFDSLNRCADYWETVRHYYTPFDSSPKSGTAEVYLHEMPGGQYTNLKEQAEAMSLGHKWPEIARAYAEVNMAFGDIVKVTPSSKVVGDMAIFLVSHGTTIHELERLGASHALTLPNSVVEMFSGALGEPDGGWPRRMAEVVLRGQLPKPGRPGEHLAPVNMEETAVMLKGKLGDDASRTDLLSYLMYPQVFLAFAQARQLYGDVSVLPTPQFYYGMEHGEEITAEIEPGKTLVIKFLTVGEPHPDGKRTVFFELNGQPREVTRSRQIAKGAEGAAGQGRSGECGSRGRTVTRSSHDDLCRDRRDSVEGRSPARDRSHEDADDGIRACNGQGHEETRSGRRNGRCERSPDDPRSHDLGKDKQPRMITDETWRGFRGS